MNYIIKSNGSIILFANGRPHTIDRTAINYENIMEALEDGRWDDVKSYLDVRKFCVDHTNGRVSISGNDIYIDKRLVKNGLTQRIVHLFKNGMNVAPLCRFLENVDENPSESSRDELYLFLESNDLPITDDGHFLAYKMVNENYLDHHTCTIRNMIGDEVTMDRNMVNPNRDQTCSTGLHFASYDYARGFGSGHLMVLKINPRDVVSIPSDYRNKKGRCCRYVVVDEADEMTDFLDKNHTSNYNDDTEYDWLPEDDNDFVELDEEGNIVDNDDHDENGVHYMTLKAQASGSKLEEGDILDIRYMVEDSVLTLKEIGEEFGISARQVARIRDREAWWWV